MRSRHELEIVKNFVDSTYTHFGNKLIVDTNKVYDPEHTKLGFCFKHVDPVTGGVVYKIDCSKIGIERTDFRIMMHEYAHIYLGHLDNIHEELDVQICNAFRDHRPEIIQTIVENCGIDETTANRLIERIIDDPQLNHEIHNIAMDMECNSSVLSKEDVEEMELDITSVLPKYEEELLKKVIDSAQSEDYKKALSDRLAQMESEAKIKLIIPERYYTGKDANGEPIPFPNDLSYVDYIILIIMHIDQFVKMMVSIQMGGNGDTKDVTKEDIQNALNGMFQKMRQRMSGKQQSEAFREGYKQALRDARQGKIDPSQMRQDPTAQLDGKSQEYKEGFAQGVKDTVNKNFGSPDFKQGYQDGYNDAMNNQGQQNQNGNQSSGNQNQNGQGQNQSQGQQGQSGNQNQNGGTQSQNGQGQQNGSQGNQGQQNQGSQQSSGQNQSGGQTGGQKSQDYQNGYQAGQRDANNSQNGQGQQQSQSSQQNSGNQQNGAGQSGQQQQQQGGQQGQMPNMPGAGNQMGQQSQPGQGSNPGGNGGQQGQQDGNGAPGQGQNQSGNQAGGNQSSNQAQNGGGNVGAQGQQNGGSQGTGNDYSDGYNDGKKAAQDSIDNAQNQGQGGQQGQQGQGNGQQGQGQSGQQGSGQGQEGEGDGQGQGQGNGGGMSQEMQDYNDGYQQALNDLANAQQNQGQGQGNGLSDLLRSMGVSSGGGMGQPGGQPGQGNPMGGQCDGGTQEHNKQDPGQKKGQGREQDDTLSPFEGLPGSKEDDMDHGSDSRKDADQKREVGHIQAGGGVGMGRGNGPDCVREVDKFADDVDMALTEVLNDVKSRVVKSNIQRDMMKLYNRGIVRSVIAPSLSRKITISTKPKLVFLIDVSGSMDTRLIDRILCTISRTLKKINRDLRYDIITWSDYLGEHLKNIDPRKPHPKISCGGGTEMARGMKYFKEHYGPEAILVLISDFCDSLDQWHDVEKTMGKYSMWGFNYGNNRYSYKRGDWDWTYFKQRDFSDYGYDN